MAPADDLLTSVTSSQKNDPKDTNRVSPGEKKTGTTAPVVCVHKTMPGMATRIKQQTVLAINGHTASIQVGFLSDAPPSKTLAPPKAKFAPPLNPPIIPPPPATPPPTGIFDRKICLWKTRKYGPA